jgi:DNA-binding transcriptional MerR regulator
VVLDSHTVSDGNVSVVMYTIGEFASIGRVSVRMLRHYDEIGLLAPARVDPSSGYRSYEGGQFAVLARILAFKDLGFTLGEVTRIVRGDVDDDALREMLLTRREALSRQLDLDAARLGRVEAHLRTTQGESLMPTITAEVKPLPARRVAQASAVAPGFGSVNISPVIGPLFDRLYSDLVAHGVRPGSGAVASYEAIESGTGTDVRVVAGFPVADGVQDGESFTVVELPGAELAATTVHHGSMATIDDSWQALMSWISENGYEMAGVCREVYLVSQPEPQEHWVTELQQPVSRV